MMALFMLTPPRGCRHVPCGKVASVRILDFAWLLWRRRIRLQLGEHESSILHAAKEAEHISRSTLVAGGRRPDRVMQDAFSNGDWRNREALMLAEVSEALRDRS